MFKFPAPDLILGQIWKEKCQIPENGYHKYLYICENHFSSTYVGKINLKAEAIPTIGLGVEDDMGIDFDFPNSPKNVCNDEIEAPFCKNCENETTLTEKYKRKYNRLLKKYKKIQSALKTERRIKKYKKNIVSKNALKSSIDCLQNISNETKIFWKLLLSFGKYFICLSQLMPFYEIN